MPVLWMLLIAVMIGVPVGACLRWPDSWFSRQVRALAGRCGTWFMDRVLTLIGDPPAPAVATATVTAGGAAPAPGPEPLPRRPVSRPLPAAPADQAQAAVLTLEGVPADHSLVHARIAEFEPADDREWLAFLAGEARAALAHGEAWLAHAETLANGVGLDPGITQAAALLADVHSDTAEMHAMLGQRLQQVYALIYQHLDDGGSLPFDGDFLTGEGA